MGPTQSDWIGIRLDWRRPNQSRLDWRRPNQSANPIPIRLAIRFCANPIAIGANPTFLNGGSARQQSHILRARTKQGIPGVLVRGSGLKQLGQEEPAPCKSPRKRRSAPRSQRHARSQHKMQVRPGWHESISIGTRLRPSQSTIQLKFSIELPPSQSIELNCGPSQSIELNCNHNSIQFN